MKQVFLIAGVPASGKSWIAKQLGDEFNYISHDDHIDKDYIQSITKKYESSDPRPILIETPFGVKDIMASLEKRKIHVKPVFIQEHPIILSRRYSEREGKPIPKGHLTRQNTYENRAKELNTFIGNSKEVLDYLKKQAE